MGLFNKKEKSVIPEVGKPEYGRQNSIASTSKGKVDPLEQPVQDRRYGRDAPKYNPAPATATAGGYGNYGNYGQTSNPSSSQAQQAQQPGYGSYQQGGPPGMGQQSGGGGGGYGAYQRDASRDQLFQGARAPSSRTGAAFDQYAGTTSGSDSRGGAGGPRESRPDYADGADEDNGEQQEQATEEDDEVEAIKQQIRFTKQESLATTRNAIRTARETEETASNTLGKLGEQTDRIANTELALDKAKGYNSRAADGAKDIRRLNQSIFRPTFQFNKQAKRDAEDARILSRHLEEKNDREDARAAASASRQRVEQGFKEAERSGKRREEAPKGRAKWEQGGRYQFEATNSDDELEQELDENLDEIAAITGRLKILATTAGQEIDAQNKHLDKIGNKVDTLDDKIIMNTNYLKRIK